MTERQSPGVEEPPDVVELCHGRLVGLGADHQATPTGLLSGNDRATVLLSRSIVGRPDRFQQLGTAPQHDRLAAVAPPEGGRAGRAGEARVDLGMGRLVGPRGNAGRVHGHVGVETRSVLGVDLMGMGISLEVGEGPELSFVAEGLVVESGVDDVDVFLEVAAIEDVLVGVLVPGADRAHVVQHLEVLDPASLVTPDETDRKPPTMHVIERGDVLGHSQWVVSGRDVAACENGHPLTMLPEKHRHDAGVVDDLEALQLEVMFRVTKSAVAGLVGHRYQLGYLAEEPLVEIVAEAGHPGFELVAPSDRPVGEEIEVQWRVGDGHPSIVPSG